MCKSAFYDNNNGRLYEISNTLEYPKLIFDANNLEWNSRSNKYLSDITFNEFNSMLLEIIYEELPGATIIIVKGSDFGADVLMEINYNNIKVRYKPYELYRIGYNYNNYEEVINDLLSKYNTRIH